MIDIRFYIKAFDLKRRLMAGKLKGSDKKSILDQLESYRSPEPVVYNIETTNACNMRCEMCPRTTMMTRSVENLDRETFIKVVDQLKPFTPAEWKKWEMFVEEKYGIPRNAMSENHFFLYIIPQVIQLHGYGDPLLDKNMPEYIEILTKKAIPSYFSCNPANINLDKTIQMFRNGLSYIKYSIESIDDFVHQKIRGKASNFTESYNKILQLLDLKKQHDYKTVIIITMLDLNRPEQKEEFKKLKAAFAGKDVYIYLKSEDQQWYREDFHGTESVHWSEFCQHPWMSMTVKSNGEAAMCMEDFNNEIILGDVRSESLKAIWNGKKYKKFRTDHLELTKGIKCTAECDMKLVGEYI